MIRPSSRSTSPSSTADSGAASSDHPRSMTTLTTHDTKRSEDARARISVLAEISDEWAETFARLRKLSPPPDGPLAELIWQAAIGAWPLSP